MAVHSKMALYTKVNGILRLCSHYVTTDWLPLQWLLEFWQFHFFFFWSYFVLKDFLIRAVKNCMHITNNLMQSCVPNAKNISLCCSEASTRELSDYRHLSRSCLATGDQKQQNIHGIYSYDMTWLENLEALFSSQHRDWKTSICNLYPKSAERMLRHGIPPAPCFPACFLSLSLSPLVLTFVWLAVSSGSSGGRGTISFEAGH